MNGTKESRPNKEDSCKSGYMLRHGPDRLPPKPFLVRALSFSWQPRVDLSYGFSGSNIQVSVTFATFGYFCLKSVFVVLV